MTTGDTPPVTKPPAVQFIKLTIIFTNELPVSTFGTTITFALPATLLLIPLILAASDDIALSNANGP